jgi:hypothetical protein
MDKLLQILDPKYYQDRNAALQQLFSLTSLIVANRGGMAREEFEQLLSLPENLSYRPYISFCTLPLTLADLSATEVRETIAKGQVVNNLIPEETAVFLEETSVFHSPRRRSVKEINEYAVRLQLINELYTNRPRVNKEIDFRTFFLDTLKTLPTISSALVSR